MFVNSFPPLPFWVPGHPSFTVETHTASYPGALSFPKDLGDCPVQSLHGHQPLGCVVEARLVTLQVALLRGERVVPVRPLSLGACWAPASVWPWDFPFISHFAWKAGNARPSCQAAVWQSRTRGQQPCYWDVVWKQLAEPSGRKVFTKRSNSSYLSTLK